MNTVKEFTSKGLIFVGGDSTQTKSFSVIFEKLNEDGAAFMNGERSISPENYVVKSFAWRTNTGVKPEFNGRVEYELSDGGKFTAHISRLNFAVTVGGELLIARWRPYLEEGSEVTAEEAAVLPPSVSDQFNQQKACPNAKPVFTQAMADRNELPPVGSECTLRYMHDSKTVTHSGIVAYASRKYCILDQVGAELMLKIGDYSYEPIDTRTPKQKAVDEMMQIIDDQDSIRNACEIIYNMLMNKK